VVGIGPPAEDSRFDIHKELALRATFSVCYECIFEPSEATMALAAYHLETAFVRGCAKTYAGEVGFSPEAEDQLLALMIGWPTVHQCLRNGNVIWSDKEDEGDAKSIVVGTGCDGERLRLTLRWSGTRYSLLVVSVERL
jgi:hypothetical protein